MKKISLCYYGNDEKGCEYDIYKNGDVTIYFRLNGLATSDVHVDSECLGCSTLEHSALDLLNFGYKINL